MIQLLRLIDDNNGQEMFVNAQHIFYVKVHNEKLTKINIGGAEKLVRNSVKDIADMISPGESKIRRDK